MITKASLQTIRKDTVGVTNKLFFNSAGSSLPPKVVVESMVHYLYQEELLGGYELQALRLSEIDTFYEEAARMLHSKASNIAFAYNATDAFAKALSAIPFEKGDTILTSNDDYISNQLAFLSLRDRIGIQVVRADNLPNGDIDLDHFERCILTYRPRLVSLTHIPTNSGLIQQAEEVGKLCKKYDIWYLLDACQSVGQLPLQVEALGCDFLSATGRKFLRGPRGTGLLYVSDKALEAGLAPLAIDMRGANWTEADRYEYVHTARRFEMWELPYASVLGLTAAIRYANNIGWEAIYNYNQQLADKMRTGLSGIDRIRLLDRGGNLCNIITFFVENHTLDQVKAILRQNRIAYSASLLGFALIDFSRKGVEWAIRFSPHYFNTEEEIETAIEGLKKSLI